LLENGLNQVVVINEQEKYIYNEGKGICIKSKHFLDRVNLVHVGIMGNAFQSWDISGK